MFQAQVAFLLFTLFLLYPVKDASAQTVPPFTLEKFTVAGGVRFGSNDLNIGLGALAGYTLRQNIYLGGIFDYWFGTNQEFTTFPGVTQTAKSSAWNILGAVGYDFGVLPTLVLRPYVGAGVLHQDVEGCGGVLGSPPIQCVSGSETDAAGVFAGQAMVQLGPAIHLGGEIRLLVSDDTFAIFAGNIGGAF
ncbi:MAG TPA: autotransporter outer membrane beta-barrel domain-containing protein [Polyangiaceae bacterium]